MNIQSFFMVVLALASSVAFVGGMIGVWTLLGIAKQIAGTIQALEIQLDSRMGEMMEEMGTKLSVMVADQERKRSEELAAALASLRSDQK